MLYPSDNSKGLTYSNPKLKSIKKNLKVILEEIKMIFHLPIVFQMQLTLEAWYMEEGILSWTLLNLPSESVTDAVKMTQN